MNANEEQQASANGKGPTKNRGGRPKGTSNKSAYNQETMTMPTSANAPTSPLNIWSDESVQEYYPNLYKEYLNISNRWKEVGEVNKDGYVTKILDANFEEQIQPFRKDEKDKIPYDNDSTIHEFAW